LPLPLIHALGTAVGVAASVVPVRERRVAEVNLRIAFPELDTRARRRLVRRSFVHIGRTWAELGALWSWRPERLLGYVREVEGEPVVRAGIESGRGVILAAPHLGAWELLGVYCSARYPMTTLYRSPRLRELEAFVKSARGRCGARLVPAGRGAVRALRRALGRGEMVGMLPDQDAGLGQGIFVPFFGQPANTMVLLPRLAARTHAAVVLGYAERLPRAAGYRLRFVAASEGIYDRDLGRAAASMNRDIERLIRSVPEQYLWSYKRFRIRPPGVPDPYRPP
jgi:KDO2-lipid IV(A) lauroyltransferase